MPFSGPPLYDFQNRSTQDLECRPRPCREVPQLMYGEDHSDCAGMEHGSTCPARCRPGFKLPNEIACSYSPAAERVLARALPRRPLNPTI